MRAVRLERTGASEVLQVTEIADPVPAPDELVVRVQAAGVNMLDVHQRAGRSPLHELPSGIGLEGAGEVTAVGTDVVGTVSGDRVVWGHALGSYAELVAVPAAEAIAVPDGLDSDLAAAVLHQGITAHYLSHSLRALREDDTVLVVAAGGGVGRLLVQLASMRGARVLAATSTQAKAAQVRALGADAVILYRDEDLGVAARELTNGRGVDVVYDPVGADTFDASLRALRVRGLYVLFGVTSGPVPPVDLQRFAAAGSLFVTRPMLSAYTATRDELEWRASAVLELARTGRLAVHVDARYSLEDAGRAHDDLTSGATTGKLLVVPTG